MTRNKPRLAEPLQVEQPDLYLPKKNVPFDEEVMRIENITGRAVKSVRPIAFSWTVQQSDSGAGNFTYNYLPPIADAQNTQDILLYRGDLAMKLQVVLNNLITNLYCGIVSPKLRGQPTQRNIAMQYIADWAAYEAGSANSLYRPSNLQTTPALFTNLYFQVTKPVGLAVIELSANFNGFEITMKS